jgi:hypothetical protein
MKPASGAEPGGIENSLLLKIQSNWLSSVIHDLSNPLFAARGYLRMLLEEKNNPLTESQHRYVITALENIERMTALTQQLNDLPGKDGFDLDVVNFRDLLPRVLPSLCTNCCTRLSNLSSAQERFKSMPGKRTRRLWLNSGPLRTGQARRKNPCLMS